MVPNLRVRLSRRVCRWFNDVSVLVRTETALHLKHPSGRFLDSRQLKYSQTLFTAHHHIRNPVRVIAIARHPGGSNLLAMQVTTRSRD